LVRDAKRRQGRHAPGIATLKDKHAGEVWVQLGRLIGCGRETARSLASVALAVYRRGPLAEGVRTECLDDLAAAALAAMDAYRRRELGAPACLRHLESERRAYLTPEAHHALVLNEDRRAEEAARGQRLADLRGALRVAANLDPSLLDGLDDQPAADLVDAAVRAHGALAALVGTRPVSHMGRARLAAGSRAVVADYERDLGIAASPPGPGGTQPDVPPAGELIKARLGMAPTSVSRVQPHDESVWRSLIGDHGQTREHAVAHPSQAGSVSVPSGSLHAALVAAYTSIGDLIIDPFAGGPTRAVIAAHTGRRYTGVELRPDQSLVTRTRIAELGLTGRAQVICADATAFDWRAHIGEGAAAASISCPPYFDLERYSDDPRDLSTAESYEQFLAQLGRAIERLTPALMPGALIAWIVGECRDGHADQTRFLPDDLRELFIERGFVTHDGTLIFERSQPPTGVGAFVTSRRMLRVHEEIVVMRLPER
jgi:hypothetical protein